MKTNLPYYALITGLLSLLAVSAKAQNLVTNGTFANYSTGWSTNCTIEINPESVYGFTNASTASNLVTEIDVERCINQPICVFTGTTYTLSFRATRRNNSATPANPGITIKAIGDVSGTNYVNANRTYNSTNFTWSTQTYTFTVPTSSNDKRINVSFTNYNNSTTYGVLVDDIELNMNSTLSINGTSSPTPNVNSTYSITNAPSSGVVYNWSFGSNASPATSAAASPSVKWSTSGPRTITAAIGNGTCVVTTLSKQVVVYSILPVTLTGFRARVNNDKVFLTWVTQQEENNRYFIVERSADGKQYDSIGVVAGTNTNVEHSYVFTDGKPLSGVGYYRLKQVDNDNNFKYSAVVNAITGSANASMRVFPNPAVDVLNCQFTLANAAVVDMQVANASGAIVLQVQKKYSAGSNSAVLPLQSLPRGIYYLKLSDASGTQQMKTFAVM